jgi:hypothetical protein
MSTITLAGWLEDIEAAIPLTPAQAQGMLKAYKVATTTGGIHPDDRTSVIAWVQKNFGGGTFLIGRFYDELQKRAKAGTVPYGIYDPEQSALSKIGRGLSETAKTATGGLRSIAIIAAVGLAGYLLLTGTIRLPKAKG